MLDKDLFFAEGQISSHVVGATVLAYPLPDYAAPNYLDLRNAIDLSRAGALFAFFRVTETFVGQATNYIRPCVMVDSTPTFANVLSHPELVIARGPDIVTGLLVAGNEIVVAIPPLNSVAAASVETAGRRYLTIGYQALVATADWSAGKLDAWLSPYPRGVRGMAHPAGH
jgi:hypothetical protein